LGWPPREAGGRTHAIHHASNNGEERLNTRLLAQVAGQISARNE
jgi:hypothetical protein